MINPFFTAIKPLTIIHSIDVEAKLRMTLQEASSVQLVSLRREPGEKTSGDALFVHIVTTGLYGVMLAQQCHKP